jgi:peptidoglycan/xylan/chitin deacetylase (PgdA/CDA1 family)
VAARVLGPPVAVLTLLFLRLTSLKAGVAIYWHGVGDPQEDPARHLVPRIGTSLLRGQLRHVSRWYRPVRASELLEAIAARPRGGRFPVALTFDDDLSSHRRVALELLPEAGACGTFFLCGATLDAPRTFWWELLEPSERVHETAERVKSMSRDERRAFARQLDRESAVESPEAGIRRDGVRELNQAGHEVGFHTLEHDPLPSLDDRELASALREGRAGLEQAAGGPLASIAYPHGDWDSRTPGAARAAGFAVGFTTAQRAIRPADDPHALGRLEAPFDSVGHLAVRLARALARSAR